MYYKKPKLSFWQIWNMNFGFFGIQFSFGLQQSNMSAIYKYLGANESEIPILWLAGPVTGLIIQPIIGAMSDGTWSPKFGRRKPYFLIGAICASIALILMPYSQSIWMAASLLWILDAGNNIAMEPYRAFISDKLQDNQLSLGFLMQSFFTGLGTTLANFTPAILISIGFFSLTDTMENGIPVSTYWAFFIGSFASIFTILYSVFTTKEYPPTDEQLEEIRKENEKGGFFKNAMIGIVVAIKEMPLTMKQLIPVKLFTWYAMFCYWQYLTSALSLSFFKTLDENSEGFKQAQVYTGQINGTYNIVCFLVAFALVPLAYRYGAKSVHFICLFLGGISIFLLPELSNSDILFSFPNPFAEGQINVATMYLSTIGIGLAWASMMSMPYQLLASSIPSQKTGVYMGIFNMFIVVPMIIQIVSMQTFVYDLLSQNPINVLKLSGVFLILAAIFTLAITTTKPISNDQ